MALFLLLLVWLVSSTAAESNSHGLAANSTYGFNYCGWHMRKDSGQSPHRFKRMGSGKLEAMKELELYDAAYSKNVAQFPLIDIANSSSMLLTGIPYSVSVGQDICSYERVLTIPSRNNERNMTSSCIISHKYSANKNGQVEALKQGGLLNNEQELDEAVGNPITATDTLNYSDLMHQYAGEDDSIEISMNRLTWELLRFAIIHLTCLGIINLLTTIFKWILNHKRIIDCQDAGSVRVYFEFIFILMLLTTTILAMSYTRSLNSMLNVEKLQAGTEEVTTELGAFQNSSTNIVHGWISKEGKEKNNSSPGDDLKRTAEDGEYATKARRENAYKKLRVRIPFKFVVHKFVKLNHKFKGNKLIKASFTVDVFKWVAAALPYKVSGEFSPQEGLKDDEEYYEEITYELYSKLNNSESFEDLRRIVIEHSRSTKHVKNGKTEMKLRILVPTKNTFHDFVKVDRDPKGTGVIVTGYSVDVFKEVMDNLPYQVSYEFLPYENGNSNGMGYYDELIQQMKLNRYDGVVGDVTITSNRSNYGDFTLPYMMSGVSMIVPVANSHTKSLWWFLKPFALKLWLLIIALFLSKAVLVWIFEHENNEAFNGTFGEQVGKALSFSFSIFVFAQKEKLKSNYSRLVVNLWIFAVFVLVTTYAANLQSMLPDNDQPIATGIEQYIMNGDYVGYQKGSFVFDLLKHMGFQEQRLKAYSSKEEYAIALSRGSRNNGVCAIIDEIPYIKVFLADYADRYTMAGPNIRPGGFGFLFQRGCDVVPDVSRAVLKFIEGEKMPELEKKWFGFREPNPSTTQIPQRDMRLSIHGFLGVLLITEPISGVALLIFIVVIICKYCKTVRDLSSNRKVEVGDNEGSSNRVGIEKNGSHKNEGSHVVQGESDQTTQNDSDLEVGAPLHDYSHSEIAFQNKSLAGDEMEKTLHSPARSSAEDIAFAPSIFRSDTSHVTFQNSTAFQNKSLAGDEMEKTLHSPARSSAEDIAFAPSIFRSDTSHVTFQNSTAP